MDYKASKYSNDPSDYGKTSFKISNERNVMVKEQLQAIKGEVQRPTKKLDDKAKSTKKIIYNIF